MLIRGGVRSDTTAIEVKLEAAGKKMTADACLQTLRDCHLNLYDRVIPIPVKHKTAEKNAKSRLLKAFLRAFRRF